MTEHFNTATTAELPYDPAEQAIEDAIAIERLGYFVRSKFFSSTGEKFGVMDMLTMLFYKDGQIVFSIENETDPGKIYKLALSMIYELERSKASHPTARSRARNHQKS